LVFFIYLHRSSPGAERNNNKRAIRKSKKVYFFFQRAKTDNLPISFSLTTLPDAGKTAVAAPSESISLNELTADCFSAGGGHLQTSTWIGRARLALIDFPNNEWYVCFMRIASVLAACVGVFVLFLLVQRI